jgi:type III restriction enzyme
MNGVVADAQHPRFQQPAYPDKYRPHGRPPHPVQRQLPKQSGKTTQHKFDAEVQVWRFPQLLEITREWLNTCVRCKDNTFPQLLLLLQLAHEAADRIYKAIVTSTPGAKALKPILRPYDPIGSTRYVDFDTTRPTYATRPDRCHVSHVVADTKSWEQKLAQTLEEMAEVRAYVKNQNLGFAIPYTFNGEAHDYYPDFLVRINAPWSSGDSPAPMPSCLNLILECTGQKKKDKEAKVTTAQSLWVPAVNNRGGFGRWAFLEIEDPWDAQNAIRAILREVGAMKSFPLISKTPGVCGGDACIRKTRIPVWTMVGFRKSGSSDEELLEIYPGLTPADVQAAWEYYEHHRAEIETAIRENDEAMDDPTL